MAMEDGAGSPRKSPQRVRTGRHRGNRTIHLEIAPNLISLHARWNKTIVLSLMPPRFTVWDLRAIRSRLKQWAWTGIGPSIRRGCCLNGFFQSKRLQIQVLRTSEHNPPKKALFP